MITTMNSTRDASWLIDILEIPDTLPSRTRQAPPPQRLEVHHVRTRLACPIVVEAEMNFKRAQAVDRHHLQRRKQPQLQARNDLSALYAAPSSLRII